MIYFASGEIQSTDPISINTQCGPDSTDIIPANLPSRIQPLDENNFGFDFSASGSFQSTNAFCPIVSYELVGDGGYRVTQEQVEDYFDFNIFLGVSGFRITLKNSFT